MHRIDGVDNDNGLFRAGDPQGAFDGTVVTADWLNDVQENIIKVIETAGLTPTKGRESDLLDAIHQRIEALTGTALFELDDLRDNTNAQKMVVAVADTAAVYWFKDPYDVISPDDGIDVVVDALGQRWRPRPTAGGVVYNDGSTTLEDLRPADEGATNRQTFYQASPPANPGDDLHVGDIWFDVSDGNRQYRWNGTTWEDAADSGAVSGRELEAAAAAQGRTIEQVVIDAIAAFEGTPVSTANVNQWSGEYTPTARAHALGISVNRTTGRVTIKHRGVNGHSGTATASIEFEVVGNTVDSFENVNLEDVLTGDNLTDVDFETDVDKWGPNGAVWDETLTNTETDSFNLYLTDFPVTNETVFRIRIRELDTDDSAAQSWFYCGDTPIIVDPPVMQIVLTVSDTSDQDVLLMINAPESAGANARSTTITIKKNYSAFATPNPGEVYIHGFNAAGQPADVDGFFVHNGAIVTIDRTQALFTGSTTSGYIVYDTDQTDSFAMSPSARSIALGVKRQGDWWYDNNTATLQRFTPTDAHVVIGTLKVEDDNVLEATIWPYGIAMGVVADANANVTETYPLVNLNINEWYTSPYSPTVAAAMFRIRIDRPNKIVEVLFGGFSSHTGSARVDVSLEIQNNTFVDYTNDTAETSLVDNVTNIDTDVDTNKWGPNGFRWTETVSATDQDKFTMETANVPGAATTFRLRVRGLESDNHVAHLALGDLMIGVDPRLPLEIVFSPRDGTDYDALILTNGPSQPGATNSKTFRQATAPANPGDDLHEGDIWFDTDDQNIPYRWDGASWVDSRDDGAMYGAQLQSDLDNLGISITEIAANSEGVPMGATNVTEWYTSPYSPTDTAAMFRIRIDRPNKIVEIRHSGHNGLVGLSSIDVELEVFNNTFVDYTGDTNEVTLTDNVTDIDFTTANLWGPNGFRWSESLTGTDTDVFTMELASVPGANTVFRCRIRTFATAGGASQTALGNLLLIQNRTTPYYFYFSPTDGTDYDVLVMQHAPVHAGATNSKTFRQTTAPANPGDDLHDGDIWFDTDDGNRQYRWNDVGNSWEEVIDTGADTGREVATGIADEGLGQTVAQFIANANAGGSSVPVVGQNVSDWNTYWTPAVVLRGSYIQFKIDKDAGTITFRHKTQNSHTGIASVKLELEIVNNSVSSFNNVSSALTPVNDTGGVDFDDDLATTKLHWGPNGVIYYETITNIGEHVWSITLSTIPLTRDDNFRLKIRFHSTTDTSGTALFALGDTAIPLNTIDVTRPKQLFFGPIDSADYDVLVMEGAEPILAGTGGSFRNGFEPSEITRWEGTAVTAETAVYYSGAQSGLFTYSGSTPLAYGTTGASRLPISDRWALEFAGQRVRISLYAKKPASSPTAEFSIAYSTNQGTETSGWIDFTPTTSWAKYVYNYDVPDSTQAGPHYLGIYADTSNSGLGLLVDNVLIETVQKPTEIDGTDLLNVSQLISSVEVSINETTSTSTLFSGGSDYDTWVDVISTTVSTTGSDLVTITGSAEFLIDNTVDTSDLVLLDLPLTSTTNWTVTSGWSHLTDKIYHTPGLASALSYSISGMTSGRYYRLEVWGRAFDSEFGITLSGNVAAFSGSIPEASFTEPDADMTYVSFKATGTTATLNISPNLAFHGYIDHLRIKRTAPGIENQPLSRPTAGPGGPTIQWRLLRGATAIHTSQEFVLSGAGQVPALFLNKVDTSSPGGSQTYKFQIRWSRGDYSAGQIATWDITSDSISNVTGTGTYWGTYMSPGHLLTWNGETAEVIQVENNTSLTVVPSFSTYTSSFSTGTSATIAVPSGPKACRIRVWGGGGGGGYNTGDVGWGGGGGGYAEKYVTFASSDVGKLFTYTVGPGGAGKSTGSSGSGTAGTASTVTTSNMSFTNLNISGGGGGAGGSVAGGAAGTSSGADIHISGSAGDQPTGGAAGAFDGGTANTSPGGGGDGGSNVGPIAGSAGAAGRIDFIWLADYEGTTAANYTSLNSYHSVLLRMAEAYIEVTEFRN